MNVTTMNQETYISMDQERIKKALENGLQEEAFITVLGKEYLLRFISKN